MISISQILNFLTSIDVQHEFSGNRELEIQYFSPLNAIKEKSITWARKNENIILEQLLSFNSVLIVVGQNIDNNQINQIIVKNPHRTFFQILEKFFNKKVQHSIHYSAVIDSTKIGENVSIGANSYIGKDVVINDNVFISNNVSIEGNVTIGKNSIIEAGVVIGVCGYGHYKDDNNTNVRVPHLGGVVIGENVAIGANTTVARGCLGDTIIENDVKIDNLCHIAHNVHIQSRSMVTACTEISGSTTIEEDVWIGPSSALINGIVVGKNSLLGIGTVATKDIPQGKVVVGVPARVLKDNE